MKYLTTGQLLRMGACGPQIALFESLYGRRLLINKANALAAARAGLNVLWAVDCLLPRKQAERGYRAACKAAQALKRDPSYDEYFVGAAPIFARAWAKLTRPQWQAHLRHLHSIDEV
jgi:hypothetical protein